MQRCDYGAGDLSVLRRRCYGLPRGSSSLLLIRKANLLDEFISPLILEKFAQKAHYEDHTNGTQYKEEHKSSSGEKKSQVQVKIPELYEIIMWVI